MLSIQLILPDPNKDGEGGEEVEEEGLREKNLLRNRSMIGSKITLGRSDVIGYPQAKIPECRKNLRVLDLIHSLNHWREKKRRKRKKAGEIFYKLPGWNRTRDRRENLQDPAMRSVDRANRSIELSIFARDCEG